MSDRGITRGGGRGAPRGGGGGGSPFRGGPGPRGGPGGGRGRGGAPAQAFRYPGQNPGINQAIQKFEDEAIARFKGDLSQLLEGVTLDEKIPLRPGYGTQGRPITLWTNHFEIEIDPSMLFHRYDIVISPASTGKGQRRLVEALLEKPLSPIAGKVATDFKKFVVTNEKIPADRLQNRVPALVENEDQPAPNTRWYTITLEPNGTFRVADLLNYLSSKDLRQAFPQKQEILQFLNIAVGHVPKTESFQYPTSMMSVQNKYYPLRGGVATSHPLGAGLEAWRGYFLSVRPATQRLLLNVQIKHAAAYQPGPLPEIMKRFAGTNDLSAYLKSALHKRELEKFLEDVRIETTHLPVKKNKTGKKIPSIKKICGFAHGSDGKGKGPPKPVSPLPHPPIVDALAAGPERVRFFYTPQKNSQPVAGLKPNSYVSVAQWFKKVYKFDCIPDFPVVNVKSRTDPSYLPIEVCVILAGQPSRSDLSPNQTAQMIKCAVRRANENANSIANQSKDATGMSGNQLLQNFTMKFSPQLIKVPARILAGPKVVYQNGQTDVRFGSWNMQANKFVRGAVLDNWSVVLISSGDSAEDAWKGRAQKAVQQFTTEMNKNSMTAKPPRLPNGPVQLQVNFQRPKEERVQQIESLFKNQLSNFPGGKPKLLLFLLSKADIPTYNKIKQMGDIVVGIHTVCAVGSKFTKPKDKNNPESGFDLGVLANISLKVNLKMGGSNHQIQGPKMGIVGEGKTMLVGLDVTHPSPGSSGRAPSILGVVASTNARCDNFPGVLHIQEARQEKADQLADLIGSRLQIWKKLNKALPENILVYRDGVSEGQYQMVLDEELPQIRQACTRAYTPAQTNKQIPRVTVVVVGKRHHTRFYPDSESNMDRSSNPPNGTIVDRRVTEHRCWDFFLQAHAAIQGTAKPAHYFVAHDEIFAKNPSLVKPPFRNPADVLEELTHNLCYLHGRATKAVSLAPPAYLADLLCERARKYLSHLFAPSAGDDTSSMTSAATLDQSSVRIHPDLADSMFYV